jgi:hypothetical protein
MINEPKVISRACYQRKAFWVTIFYIILTVIDKNKAKEVDNFCNSFY